MFLTPVCNSNAPSQKSPFISHLSSVLPVPPLRCDISQVSCGFLQTHQKARACLIIFGWQIKKKEEKKKACSFYFFPLFYELSSGFAIHKSWHRFHSGLPEITPQPFHFFFFFFLYFHLFHSCHRFGKGLDRLPDVRLPFRSSCFFFFRLCSSGENVKTTVHTHHGPFLA